MLGRWQRASRDLPHLLYAWCAMALALSLARLLLLAALGSRWWSQAQGTELLAMLSRGFGFDSRSATAWVAPALATALLSATFPAVKELQTLARITRRALVTLFLLLTPLLSWVTLDYYREFSQPLGHHLFNFIYDDQAAVMAALFSDYGLLYKLPLALLVSAGLIWLYRRGAAWRGWPRAAQWLAQRSLGSRVVLSILAVLCIAVAARGSMGQRPAVRKWSAVTSQPVLNHLVLNPYSQLRYALRDHRRLATAAQLETYLPDGDVRAAVQRLGAQPTATTLTEAFARTAKGADHPPRHVFLIQLESMDLWPLDAAYTQYNITPALNALAREGVLFTRFLPCADTTINAIASTLLGLADPEVFTARRPSAQATFPTALPAQMQRLGYRTRGFYGGLLSWQHLGRFWQSQGMEEVYGSADLEAPLRGWGADDGALYQHVLRRVDPSEPSFTMVVTLSYHPPFDLDLHREGIVVGNHLAPLLSNRLGPQQLGHLMYMDREVGRFVKQVAQRYPQALVVLAGDHRSRRFPAGLSDPHLTRAVPLILWGHGITPGRRFDTGGSHLDIAPTLIERVAPAGFVYAAMGDDLLHPRDTWGVGHRAVIGPRDLLTLGDASPATPRDTSPPNDTSLLRLYRDTHGVAWWWIMRGTQLP